MTSEKDFYIRHYEKVQSNIESNFSMEYKQKGSRYFCIYDFLKEPSKFSAIEWGGGPLAKMTYLSSLFNEFCVVDVAAPMLVKNEQVNVDSIPFDLFEYNLNENLPFKDISFDVVIAMMVIEHLFDPFHSFREAARITKKEGVIFINLPIVTSIKNRLRLLFGKLPQTSSRSWEELEEWDGGHLHYFTIDKVKWLGEKYGLTLVKIYPVGKYFGLKKLFPSIFCNEVSFVFVKN